MNLDVQEMGPIDYMVFEFPGARFSGKGLPLLIDLVDRRIVRILDMLFVRKLPDGSVMRIELADRTDEDKEQLALFEGATSGLLDQGDIDAATEVIEPGSAAGLIVFENRWAAPLATQLRRDGARMVASGRIPTQSILAALDALEGAYREAG